jgi:hypothetical protein
MDSTPASASAASHAAIFELLSTIGIAAREQDLAKLLAPRLGVTPAVGFDGGVVLMMYAMTSGICASPFLATVPSWRSISLRAMSSSR